MPCPCLSHIPAPPSCTLLRRRLPCSRWRQPWQPAGLPACACAAGAPGRCCSWCCAPPAGATQLRSPLLPLLPLCGPRPAPPCQPCPRFALPPSPTSGGLIPAPHAPSIPKHHPSGPCSDQVFPGIGPPTGVPNWVHSEVEPGQQPATPAGAPTAGASPIAICGRQQQGDQGGACEGGTPACPTAGAQGGATAAAAADSQRQLPSPAMPPPASSFWFAVLEPPEPSCASSTASAAGGSRASGLSSSSSSSGQWHKAVRWGPHTPALLRDQLARDSAALCTYGGQHLPPELQGQLLMGPLIGSGAYGKGESAGYVSGGEEGWRGAAADWQRGLGGREAMGCSRACTQMAPKTVS